MAERNVAASVRARLLNLARERHEDFQLLLTRYAAERFLFRLGESSSRDRLILKGAMAFVLWGGDAYRPTRDIDVAGFGAIDAEALPALVRTICAVSCEEDGLSFLVEQLRIEPIQAQAGYGGFRLSFDATLGGANIPVRLDIGIGDAVVPDPTDETYPTLLEGLPPPSVRVYPRDAVVAEKLHALVVLGEVNSRLKDFHDLYVFGDRFAFSGPALAASIAATFQRRTTPFPETPPEALLSPFFADTGRAAHWRAYLDRDGLHDAPKDFATLGERLRGFLWPPLRALASAQPFPQDWPSGGPWR